MRKLIFIIIFWFIADSANAQNFYSFKIYNRPEGLPLSHVYCLLQDSKGYIWAGTRGGGICKFDGITFTTYTTQDGLASNFINEMLEFKNGNIYIATEKGLSIFDGKTIKSYLPKNKDLEINSITENKNALWASTNKGVYIFDIQTKLFSKYNELDSNLIVNQTIQYNNQILASTDKGLYILPKEQEPQLIANTKNMPINCMKIVGENVLIGTNSNGIFSMNKNNVLSSFSAIFKNQNIRQIATYQNTLLVSTYAKGICLYNNNNFYNWIDEKVGLPINNTRCAIMDANRNLWIGTSGGGLAHRQISKFEQINEKQGLPNNYIYSVCKTKNNDLWIGTYPCGVNIIRNDSCMIYNAKNKFVDAKVKYIVQDLQENIWLGTELNGIYIYNGNTFENIGALKNKTIRGIAIDADNIIWIATAGYGLYKLVASNRNTNNYTVTNFTTKNGLINNRLTAIFVDKNNKVWYGTEKNGAYIFDGERKSEAIKNLPSNNIRCIKQNKNNEIFIGTDEGLSKINIDKNEIIGSALRNVNLISNNIYQLEFDAQNNIYIGTEKGLDKITVSNNTLQHFGFASGYIGIESNWNASFSDGLGGLWFGTINGLAHYNANASKQQSTAPILNMQAIKINYVDIFTIEKYKNKINANWQTNDLCLSYLDNKIGFEFLGIDFNNGKNMQYQWQLMGVDETWSPKANSNTTTYQNLSAGEYVFKLKAINDENIESAIQQISFSVKAPWYKMVENQIVVILALFALGFLGYKWRINNIKYKSKQLQKQLEQEKELLELEQKSLRLQMNPHFIFNALNSIQGIIGTGKDEEARYYIAKFGKLMRQILENSREQNITLQQELQMLDNYLKIEQLTSTVPFRYQIIVDENMETDFVKLPPMLLQPFVENAIKHGIKPLVNKAGEVIIACSEMDNNIQITITDNGVGRSVAMQNKVAEHQSVSMDITQRRLDLLNTNTTFPLNKIEIIDIKNDAGEAMGTKIILQIQN
jgi:ligand-binding sensor domain-containing protein